MAVDYQTVLQIGLKGYEERVKKLKSELDLCKPESIDKYVFYKAVLTVIEAVKTYAHRFSVLAKELAKKAERSRNEPTRGIDVAAKVEIYNLMNQLKHSMKRFNLHGLFN